jgi:type IV pilus assembly protein PilW
VKTPYRKEIRQCGHPITGRGGFTLVETIIAMAIGIVLLGSLYGILSFQNRMFHVQEENTDMIHNARLAMDLLFREIRMAGYHFNPSLTAAAGIIAADAQTIVFTQDLNGDGDTTDAGESITFALQTEGGIQKLMRTSGGASSPIAVYVDTLAFRYWDDAGNELASPVVSPDQIRKIKITLTTRSVHPDPGYPQNGGYRLYALTSQVFPRNTGQ